MSERNAVSVEPTKAYKYCPKCAGMLEHKGENWLKCARCSYNFFVNAAPGIGVFIFDKQKRVLLAKRKVDPKKGTWETPGGFMHPGEVPEEAIRREIQEELGVKVAVDKYVGSMPGTYDYGGVILPFIGLYFTATITEGEIKPDDDVAEARFFKLSELEGIEITYPALPGLIKQAVESLE
jgi:NADH pyrophosphatase NudC (nudix superfamily)